MAFRKLTVLATALLSARGLRKQRKTGASSAVATIEGVEVHKYSDEAQDFIILFCQTATNDDIKAVCKGKCTFEGHPSQRGAPFAVVRGRAVVEKLLKRNKAKVELLEVDAMDYMIPEMESIEGPSAQSTASWGLERSGVPGATTTGSGVHIYVQDTGVRGSHDDFGGRASPALDMTSGAVVECDSDDCAGDVQGHGTHCAGTAAGTKYGVAKDAFVHAVKTLSDEGSGARSWQMAALDWLALNAEKPAVVSMSLGGNGKDPSYDISIGAVTDAGITVVVAAGNSNADACDFSPAFAEKAITVGATDSRNRRASYSNFGNCVNIMAPGSDIVSASQGSDSGSSSKSGTSMACPHVSGGAALLLEANPDMTSDQILAKMKDTARLGYIGELKENDPDEFLWVSAEAPPPTTAPTGPCWGICGPTVCSFSVCRGCSFC